MEAVLKTGDIEKLTKDCYNFTMNISGFIAHYNHYGFMDNYRNVADLIAGLENSSDISRPDYYTKDRFFSEGDQAEYYASKARILTAFGELARKYKMQNLTNETSTIENKWEALKGLANSEYTTAEKKVFLSKLNLI